MFKVGYFKKGHSIKRTCKMKQQTNKKHVSFLASSLVDTASFVYTLFNTSSFALSFSLSSLGSCQQVSVHTGSMEVFDVKMKPCLIRCACIVKYCRRSTIDSFFFKRKKKRIAKVHRWKVKKGGDWVKDVVTASH